MSSDFPEKSLPPPLARMISGYTRRQNHVGFSPSKVFRLDAENKSALYLKIAPRHLAHSLRREKMKLEWLKNRLPVPEVLFYADGEDADYLLLSARRRAIDARLAGDSCFIDRRLPV
jgi:aminoglycoside phosphotransferase